MPLALRREGDLLRAHVHLLHRSQQAHNLGVGHRRAVGGLLHLDVEVIGADDARRDTQRQL